METYNTEFTIINIGSVSMNKFWNETERMRSASATCTLLEVGGRRLLVDPSPGPELLEPMLFDRSGLRPRAIDQIYLTHFHGDHRYGLELFEEAEWLMAEEGLAEWRERSPSDLEIIERFTLARSRLPEGIQLYPTPGHTWGHHALLARTEWGQLIVTGDAVMTKDFFQAEEGYHNSVDFERAAETIRDIKRTADLVIPGHGNLILNLRRGS